MSIFDKIPPGYVSAKAARKGNQVSRSSSYGADSDTDTVTNANAQKGAMASKATATNTKRGGKTKPLPAGRSAMASVLSSTTTRSLPTSPALNAAASPNPAFSASQQLLEKNKSQRFVLVHELATRDQAYDHLKDVWRGAEADLKPTVEKVASFDDFTKKWSLNKMYWKELDVWNYDYRSYDDRQAAIDNAIRQFDRQRIPTSASEWERLLPPTDRGKGIVLSKLQATLAKGHITPTTRAPAMKTDDGNKSDLDTTKGKSEAMARSNSQPVGSKTKKVSEREAQTKRLLSNNPKKAAPKKPAARAKATEEKGKKFLSEEKVIDSESSGEDAPLSTTSSSMMKPKIVEKPVDKPVEKPVEKRVEKPATKAAEKLKEKPAPAPAPKPKPVVRAPRPPAKASVPSSQKRTREDDDSSSSSGAPLSKRIKPKELPKPISTTTTTLKHRPSDVSPNSRNTGAGTATSSNLSMKSKNTSPTKSSPLASSPPTNASDFEDHKPQPAQRPPKSQARNGERETNGVANGSSAPNGASQSKKRKERDVDQSSSQQSSQQSTPSKKQRVTKDILIKARMFNKYYERYESLHHEISALKEPPEDKLADLLDMRERLSTMKEEISQAVSN
ncbi:hypothetical protein GGS23DRAFT_359137 [Durotheca rogersii]|uniref:uncharacterized protein n=1 Tax=Durotheca rogersii TaxID=419775 RepID=UPI00221E9DB4|nr:uncharacterized protein GGS23DRAFT_359137 [Durotheca rogersii]KAI5865896.1 hypothetical protein GGS23DRAFT_359137 [Durotheca rogersii]